MAQHKINFLDLQNHFLELCRAKHKAAVTRELFQLKQNLHTAHTNCITEYFIIIIKFGQFRLSTSIFEFGGSLSAFVSQPRKN